MAGLGDAVLLLLCGDRLELTTGILLLEVEEVGSEKVVVRAAVVPLTHGRLLNEWRFLERTPNRSVIEFSFNTFPQKSFSLTCWSNASFKLVKTSLL